jgi:hypothetical protein
MSRAAQTRSIADRLHHIMRSHTYGLIYNKSSGNGVLYILTVHIFLLG